jgi:hypothetical protein
MLFFGMPDWDADPFIMADSDMRLGAEVDLASALSDFSCEVWIDFFTFGFQTFTRPVSSPHEPLGKSAYLITAVLFGFVHSGAKGTPGGVGCPRP